jgi:hypothetical protein
VLIIAEDQDAELGRRLFRGRLHRFLTGALIGPWRARLGSLAEVASLWAGAPVVEGASEHDLAVYLAFVWFASVDPEAARRLAPARDALGSPGEVLAMKHAMVDAGMLDICAFDRG